MKKFIWGDLMWSHVSNINGKIKATLVLVFSYWLTDIRNFFKPSIQRKF